MMLPAQRKCDVCSKPIDAGTKFLRVRYELYEDNKPQVGSAGGGSIHASNEVEAHEECCAPDFFLLLDLHLRSKSAERGQRNRWSHENAPIDPVFAAAVVGVQQSTTRELTPEAASVKCPRCGAIAGHQCKTETGGYHATCVHAERAAAALQTNQKGSSRT